ncbi:ketopantoate reductase [Rhizobium sp. ERR 922]|uniref:2-dehydropantoate 2-reductase n=1 Tax=unclassified Rhizobium TaxID=2613769 RepID=UPI0011A6EA0A|nr:MULTISPECIES: 2-dehydropantoate 2-reductase [unclassified Rhizobium]TWB45538.1 ketopantoate reductase [Rhizobium sp. ERR 922]TWB88227.1 ketopantoate reductase [Rhizobium sp. ERR 942]
MRILVVGAGSIGGYFGGRLAAAGRDVTFLVRERRAEMLRKDGLKIVSPAGDLHIPAPSLILSQEISTPFDLIILSCKAYDLDEAARSFSPAVGPRTLILPLLNGMRHLDLLDERFGRDHVLGGQCMISTTLDADGTIRHLAPMQTLVFGARLGTQAKAAAEVSDVLSSAAFDVRLSADISQDMWDKWVFIASSAGITTLLRASIGDIVAAGGSALSMALLEECLGIAARSGHPSAPQARERAQGLLTAAGSPMTASMMRDMENGARIEADHIIGDLIARSGDAATPLLNMVLVNLKAYQNRRSREAQH